MILIDTHLILWILSDASRLSSSARGAIDRARSAGEGLAISDISLLELATLAAKGRIHLDISLESFLNDVQTKFTVLPITGRACVIALGLAGGFPKDPADRIIAGTAISEGLPLLTADREIRRLKTLRTIW